MKLKLFLTSYSEILNFIINTIFHLNSEYLINFEFHTILARNQTSCP